jgi:hypothetical protein
MKVISDPTSPEYMALDAENKYNSVLSALEWISALLCQKECTLGPIEQQQLCKLVTSPYLCDRMNVLALKIRIWDKLRSWKFELEQLEQHFENKWKVCKYFPCLIVYWFDQ